MPRPLTDTEILEELQKSDTDLELSSDDEIDIGQNYDDSDSTEYNAPENDSNDSVHSSESSVDEDDNDDDGTTRHIPVQLPQTEGSRISKAGIEWKDNPPVVGRTPQRNIITFHAGPARGILTHSPKSAFDLFISPDILQEICLCTNKIGKRIAQEKRKSWKEIDYDEMCAYLGFIILAGVERNWDVPARELFSEVHNPHYRACFSVGRFELIRRLLRFDDKRTRDARLKNDKLAAISHVWNIFLNNCRTNYIPGDCVTIDEQLVPFRGRCPFTQYIPSKPAKYGVKIFWMCDSKSAYAADGLVYVGRQPGQHVQKNLGFTIVDTLTLAIRNSGRNVTTDNFFTSVPLAEELLSKRLTLVGTIRQNKREIPPCMKPHKNRQLHSATFGFHKEMTMVSYVTNPRKCVVLLSTMHNDTTIIDGPKSKPEIVTFYNSTKSGVDILDKMVRTYSCKRQTRRWPVAVFCNMVDVAALNGYIIFMAQNSNKYPNVKHKRRLYLVDLAKELILPQILKRSIGGLFQKQTRLAMTLCGVELPQPCNTQPSASSGYKRKRCSLCPSKEDNKTSITCSKCQKFICKGHSKVICIECDE